MSQLSLDEALDAVDRRRPVLIAGPTASGKSALAIRIAQEHGGVVVNADASQVYDCWKILTARPDAHDEEKAPHLLYGHVSCSSTYSTGQWLREIEPLLKGAARPIIVGGTGLYFTALTKGLAAIPSVPAKIRVAGDRLTREAMLEGLDKPTREKIDVLNRARVQRAWEVLTTTGKGLATWQEETPAPLLSLEEAHAFVLNADKPWLNRRIEKRFDQMIASGVLDEIRQVAPTFDPTLPAHRAIGAPELVAHIRGELGLDEARAAAIIATKQYAKRQRTWFRSKMKHWTSIMT